VAVACAIWGLNLTVAATQEPSQRSVTDRIYSAEQADRGRTLFRDVCITCHPDPFWRSSWEGRTLGDLYTKIVKFMPDDAPGTLSAAEAASAVAYILQSNGFEAGETALPADEAALGRIRVEAPSK
jgi:mono/diheme cytochrome c family protein